MAGLFVAIVGGIFLGCGLFRISFGDGKVPAEAEDECAIGELIAVMMHSIAPALTLGVGIILLAAGLYWGGWSVIWGKGGVF